MLLELLAVPIHAGGWRIEKEWKERKVGLEKGEQQSKTCISMFLLQKRAITEVPSVLECMRKSVLFMWKFCLCWGLTSQSTIFQSCRDGATASWVINQYFRGVKCLAQGHNTAAVDFEPPTSRFGVRHSTTEPPRSPFHVKVPFFTNTLPCPFWLLGETLWVGNQPYPTLIPNYPYPSTITDNGSDTWQVVVVTSGPTCCHAL